MPFPSNFPNSVGEDLVYVRKILKSLARMLRADAGIMCDTGWGGDKQEVIAHLLDFACEHLVDGLSIAVKEEVLRLEVVE